MKRVISLIMIVTILCTMFVTMPVSAASSVVGSSELLFYSDFDDINPDAVKLDANAIFEDSDYGKALKITTAADENGTNVKRGAYFAVDSFTHGNEWIKFDIKHSAGYHFHGSLWDSTGTHRTFRIQKSDLTTNTWYTYLIDPYTLVDGKYVGYRKLKDGTTWEAATIIRYGDSGTTDTYTNTLKLGSGSASSNSNGIWYVDNVAVYSNVPAANVVVPENISTPNVNYLYEDDFEGPDYGLDVKVMHDVGADPDDENNGVVLYDLSGSTTVAQNGGTVRTTEFKFPADKTPYTVSFDLRVESHNTDDYIWVQTRDDYECTCARISLSQFEKDEWYTVTYTADGNGTDETTSGVNKSSAVTGKKILKKDGSSSSLTVSASKGWTSSKDKICITTYNANGANYTVDETTGTTPWANVKLYIDNLSFTYESAKYINAELITTETTGDVLPLVAAYDANGVLTAVTEGTTEGLETVTGFGGVATAEFDIMNNIDAYMNASSVKTMFIDSYSNVKAYADVVEIGAKLPANGSAALNLAEITVTADMIPGGATGNYSLMAYTVPFTVSKNNIPAYDADKHTMVALVASEDAISSFKYNADLYDGQEQDMVIICNADGASKPVVTLYEENKAPEYTNIVMLLGKDITERNFTWYSLDNGAGKITYQKKSEMVDGAFSAEAMIVDADRCHEDDVYSTKEYYYQNEAVITGLEPGETYVYQLSNGESKSEMYTIKIGEASSSFSFIFGGDPQVGGNNDANYEQEHKYWGRSVKQMVTAPEFEGVDFFLSAGDQVESGDTVADIEAQYDIYANHEEWATFPMAVTLGNHDAKAEGMHTQHFNEPNMIINPDTGRPYGESPTASGAVVDGADYYFVYNSVLFMHINLNTFDDLSNGAEASRLDDKADAEEHAAFINAVLEETKDNKDILWKVVYCHQSPFGGSYHGNYTKKADGTYSRTEQYDYINIREYLVPYLYEADVDLVLSGHDHTYTRSHIIKPNENDDILGDELNSMVITPYANTEGANYYTYADGTTTPKFVSWTDKSGNVFDGSAENRPYLQVSSKPVKVTDPDGFLWVTGSSSSGSQVNAAQYPNHYAAVCQQISQRSLSRIDITPTSLKLVTYNIGTNEINNDPLQVIDEFEIVKTATVSVGGVSVDDAATIAVGQSKVLDAKLSPAQPSNNKVTWASENEAVAKVDENGVVTAIAAGTANITVTTDDGGFTDTCVVTVVDAVPVTAITLPETATMEALTTKTLVATVVPETATTKALKWTTSNAEIATVDQNGNVTAHKNGEVTITVTATDGSGISATCVVTVTYIPMTKFELNTSALTMKVMDVATMTYSFAPSNATFKDITWSSSAPQVVSVDEKGNIEALRVGTAVITATNAAGDSASCTVTSIGGVNFLEDFEDDELNLATTATWSFVTEEDGNRVFDYDGSKQASMSNLNNYLESGMYNAPIADGEHTISFDYKKTAEGGYPALEFKTYSHDGVYDCVRFSIAELDLNVWYNVKLVYTKEDGWVKYYKKTTDTEYSVSTAVTYTSSNHTTGVYFDRFYFAPYIAKSSADMNNGSDSSEKARLANAQKTKFRIDNIKFSTAVAVTGLTLAETAATMEIGDTKTIVPSFAPSNATDINVTYKSSNEAVATVNRLGKVTAVGAGDADITVTSADGGYTATYAVKVNAIIPEITVVKDGTKFTVTTNVAVNGEKVYIAAYDASNVMIAATLADYVADGTALTLAADGATYYKAFIWGAGAVPVVSEKLFN